MSCLYIVPVSIAAEKIPHCERALIHGANYVDITHLYVKKIGTVVVKCYICVCQLKYQTLRLRFF